jgi:hypothetical protein
MGISLIKTTALAKQLIQFLLLFLGPDILEKGIMNTRREGEKDMIPMKNIVLDIVKRDAKIKRKSNENIGPPNTGFI